MSPDPERVGSLGKFPRQNFVFLTYFLLASLRKHQLSGALKSRRDGAKGRGVGLPEADGKWGVQTAGLATLPVHGDSFVYLKTSRRYRKILTRLGDMGIYTDFDIKQRLVERVMGRHWVVQIVSEPESWIPLE